MRTEVQRWLKTEEKKSQAGLFCAAHLNKSEHKARGGQTILVCSHMNRKKYKARGGQELKDNRKIDANKSQAGFLIWLAQTRGG